MENEKTSAGPGSEVAVEDMITHLDEMFEDDAKNHDELFEQWSNQDDPDSKSDHWPEEEEWFD